MGPNGSTLAPGTAHALPRRTQPAVGLVVDGGPSAAWRHHRADAERDRAVAGGKPGGRGPDRARSVPLLQSSRDVPAAVLLRADLRLLHVAAADPAHGADRVRRLDRPDRRNALDGSGGEGI